MVQRPSWNFPPETARRDGQAGLTGAVRACIPGRTDQDAHREAQGPKDGVRPPSPQSTASPPRHGRRHDKPAVGHAATRTINQWLRAPKHGLGETDRQRPTTLRRRDVGPGVRRDQRLCVRPGRRCRRHRRFVRTRGGWTRPQPGWSSRIRAPTCTSYRMIECPSGAVPIDGANVDPPPRADRAGHRPTWTLTACRPARPAPRAHPELAGAGHDEGAPPPAKLRCCPRRATTIVPAILGLHRFTPTAPQMKGFRIESVDLPHRASVRSMHLNLSHCLRDNAVRRGNYEVDA